MGFWRNVGKIFTAPTHLVSRAVEKIGSWMSESTVPIIYKSGDFIEKVGQAMEPIFYREETATTKDVIDISIVCKGYYIEASEKINNEMRPLISSSENKLDAIKKEIILLVPTDIYEVIKGIATESVDVFNGILKKANDKISEKISISNDEFKEFLSIYSDDERKEKCHRYIGEVMTETLNCYTKEIISETNKKILEMVTKIKEYSDDIEEDLLKNKREQEELLAKKDDIEHTKVLFSKKVVDLSYLSGILACTDNN